MDEIRDKILSFRDLKDNWNGYGAKPISQESVDAALNFLYTLEFLHIDCEVFPTANDTIQFEIEISKDSPLTNKTL